MIYELPENYFVRGLRSSDLNESYLSWFENQEVSKFNSHGKFFKNLEALQDFYNSQSSEDKVVWAICHQLDGHVGNVSLQGMSFINRNAEFAILIGNPEHWGKSVGLNASKVLLRHGFEKLNLERVYCGTSASNIAMQKLALQLGMVEEGRRRKHLYLNGQWEDVIEYGVLRHEFKS